MALILDLIYSATLTECNSLTAIVPMENNEKSSYPVLWLLPPAVAAAGDSSLFVRLRIRFRLIVAIMSV